MVRKTRRKQRGGGGWFSKPQRSQKSQEALEALEAQVDSQRELVEKLQKEFDKIDEIVGNYNAGKRGRRSSITNADNKYKKAVRELDLAQEKLDRLEQKLINSS